MSAEVRLRRLQQLVLDPGFLGLEPLLDLLLGVHQELGASDLAQDKYVADFLEWGECPPFCRGFSTLSTPYPRPRFGDGGRAEGGGGSGLVAGGRMDIGRASHSGAQNLGRRVPPPVPHWAGQSGVSRGQGSHDSEPRLGSHGQLGWALPLVVPLYPLPESRPRDLLGSPVS